MSVTDDEANDMVDKLFADAYKPGKRKALEERGCESYWCLRCDTRFCRKIRPCPVCACRSAHTHINKLEGEINQASEDLMDREKEWSRELRVHQDSWLAAGYLLAKEYNWDDAFRIAIEGQTLGGRTLAVLKTVTKLINLKRPECGGRRG